MNFSKVAVKRPVTTFMCVLIAIAFGILSITTLNMDLLPNMNIPVAIVMTTYEGAGPEEIEQLITQPIEKSMGTVSGLDELSSTSSNGTSMVIVQFQNDIDIDMAAIDMREKIDLIKGSLPDDANDPMVVKLDINAMNGIQISAFQKGKDISELKTIIDDGIADRLERQDGVASVDVIGGRDTEIQIVLKEEKLRGYGISESTISQVLRAENSNTPSGDVYQGDKNLTVRVKGEFKSLEEMKNIPISNANGSVIYLRDVADVSEVFKDVSSTSYTNGIPSINLYIQKQSTANTVNVSKSVMSELERIKADYPEIEFLVIVDPADYINNALQSVVDSALQGGIFAVIVLYIFLRNFRSTMVVGTAMPISIISTFALMKFSGINLNMMSLGGLALGIGMLVDNSIVVLESIYKKLEEGKDKFEAATEGAREVTNSVVASTLTTIAVFLPITLVGGITAEMFNDLSLTIVYSLTASLIVSITFVPMASYVLLDPECVANVHKHNNIFTKLMDGIGHGLTLLESGYRKLLNGALRFKKVTLLIAVIAIFLTGTTIPKIGMEMMPQSDEGQVNVSIELPKGSRIGETEKITWKVVNAIENVEEIQDISFRIGGSSMMGGSEDSASISISLVEKFERERSSAEVAQEMRGMIKDIAGANIEIAASSGSMGSYSGGGTEINIYGDDLDTLKNISNDMIKRISTIPGTSEVKSSMEDAAPQTTIRVNRDKASIYGISSSSIANIVKTAISGSVATTYKIDGDEYDIRIMQDGDRVNYVNDINNILIPSSFGTSVPLEEIADIVSENTPTSITRDNQKKYVSVSANLTGIDLSSANKQIEEKMKDYVMPENYTWEFAGTTTQMAESFLGLFMALIISVLLVYMIMAAEFEAFSYPFIVMFAMPIAMTGGILGLFITGQALSITGLLGLIMLAGVVVNNAIVLIDYANLLRRERGYGITEAMKIAGPTRLRPILMSTLTTVLSMIPMMVSQAEGSETMRGLATVVVFGLTLSTLITLVLIPVIYVGYCNMSERRKAKKLLRKQKKMQIQG